MTCPRRVRVLLAVLSAACGLSAAAPPETHGSAGLGDRLFPRAGNGGYDVRAYDVSLDYRRNDRPLGGVTRVSATATRRLGRFDLDFAAGRVRGVRVNGRAAAFRLAGGELVVTPAAPVRRGGPLDVVVRHTSDPRGAAAGRGGWVRTRDGLVVAGQPDAAHLVFPCNDHPSDKAAFTFRITTPPRLTAVTNGTLTSRTGKHGRTTWTYRTAHPMAPELAQIAVGRYAVVRRTGPHGLPLRHVVAPRDTAALESVLATVPGHLAWLERRLGRYPFETYGLLSADAETGYALETQTLVLLERSTLLESDRGALDRTLVHELAHHWFGNSVSPATWSDLWLNEGHATWYEWLYAARGDAAALDAAARRAHRADPQARRTGGPPAAPRPPGTRSQVGIFRDNVYDGGALVLYALRQRMGAAAFGRLEREWVRRHRDGHASTADFTALASRVAGRDLGSFLRRWLYGSTTPALPTRSRRPADTAPPAPSPRAPSARAASPAAPSRAPSQRAPSSRAPSEPPRAPAPPGKQE